MTTFETSPPQESPDSEFERKKQIFFTKLGLSVREAIKVQKGLGLFEKKPVEDTAKFKTLKKRLERKHQAPEHMLVVTARTKVLAEWLNLNPEIIRKITVAAALHDAFKAEERKITEPKGFTYKSFREAEEAETEALLAAGVPDDLVQLSHAAGHPLNEAQKKLAQEDLSEMDWAWLVLHYVDMSTRGTTGAVYDPIEVRLSHDETVYTEFDKSAIGEIEGHPEESGFQAMRRTGMGAAERIAQELNRQHPNYWSVDPKALLRLVDTEIKTRIQETPLPVKEDIANQFEQIFKNIQNMKQAGINLIALARQNNADKATALNFDQTADYLSQVNDLATESIRALNADDVKKARAKLAEALQVAQFTQGVAQAAVEGVIAGAESLGRYGIRHTVETGGHDIHIQASVLITYIEGLQEVLSQV